MREPTQTSGCPAPPAERKPWLPLGGGLRLAGLGVLAWLCWAPSGAGQTMRLGPFELYLIGQGEVGYDSNVDGVYPEDEEDGLQKGDFYWMPGLRIRSESVPMYPRTTLSLSAALSYQDYFARNDLDTEVYNVFVNFQTTHPRLTLGGRAGVDYSVDGVKDQYVPGSASRDPVLTREANVFANWNYRKLRIQGSADYSIELHQFEEFQDGDTDETKLLGAVYLDLFKWGSLFYSWENTVTTMIQTEDETEETVQTFGFDGAIPLEILRRPKVTYRFGVSYEDEENEGEEPTQTWEPTHTITVSDEFQFSKSLHLAASAIWENTEDDDEVSFQYNAKLTQQLGPRAQHALSFTREPRPTFGSTADTETTTYGYNFSISDLIVYGLTLRASAIYDLSTPLEPEGALTEKTTTVTVGLSHTRQLSRKLTRVAAYVYEWEDSNFHDEGAKEQHVVTYGFTYQF